MMLHVNVISKKKKKKKERKENSGGKDREIRRIESDQKGQ